MIVNADTVQSTEIAADICIIGGGAAGLTVASEFLGSAQRVVVIESGGTQFDRRTQALSASAFPSQYDTVGTRRRVLGGTTSIWHGRCMPLHGTDFETRHWAPWSGWPISRSHLDPYYERARAICRTGFDNASVARQTAALGNVLPLADAGLRAQLVEWSHPFDFGAEHASDLAASKNVAVYVKANALGVKIDRSGDSVEAVPVATLSGNRFNIKARQIVLATGGIENARLLLTSDISAVSEDGHNLVGAFFMDHRYFEVGPIRGTSGSFPPEFTVHGDKPHENNSHGIMTLSPDVLRVEELVNCAAYFRAAPRFRHTQAYVSDAVMAAREIARHVRRREVPARLGRLLGAVARRPQEVIEILGRGLIDRFSPANATGLRVVVEAVPNPLSRVSLSGSRDSLGLRRVNVKWLPTDLEKQSAHRFLERLEAMLASEGLGRLPEVGDAGWPAKVQPGAHHMGTTRMHVDPRFGVVNSDGRVHGIRNLYVAGSSVFPTSGIANPTLTIVALAARLADHLRAGT